MKKILTLALFCALFAFTANAQETADSITHISQNIQKSTHIPPFFYGGKDALTEYIKNGLNKHREKLKSGKTDTVEVYLEITDKGDIQSVHHVGKNTNKSLKKEIIQIISKLPSFTPALYNGKEAKASNVSLRMIFKLNDNAELELKTKLYASFPPEYINGEKALKKLIYRHLRYPAIDMKTGIQGKVIVRFQVTTEGKIEKIKVVKGLTPSMNKEAVRVVKKISGFKPAIDIITGKAIKYNLTQSFSFQIED